MRAIELVLIVVAALPPGDRHRASVARRCTDSLQLLLNLEIVSLLLDELYGHLLTTKPELHQPSFPSSIDLCIPTFVQVFH